MHTQYMGLILLGLALVILVGGVLLLANWLAPYIRCD